jgi:putative transposase
MIRTRTGKRWGSRTQSTVWLTAARLVVRNGHSPEREIVGGIGPSKVRQPRVRHRDQGRFSSAILPRFMRRTPSVDALIPALYLKGISTGDFSEALAAILGEKASGLRQLTS